MKMETPYASNGYENFEQYYYAIILNDNGNDEEVEIIPMKWGLYGTFAFSSNVFDAPGQVSHLSASQQLGFPATSPPPPPPPPTSPPPPSPTVIINAEDMASILAAARSATNTASEFEDGSSDDTCEMAMMKTALEYTSEYGATVERGGGGGGGDSSAEV